MRTELNHRHRLVWCIVSVSVSFTNIELLLLFWRRKWGRGHLPLCGCLPLASTVLGSSVAGFWWPSVASWVSRGSWSWTESVEVCLWHQQVPSASDSLVGQFYNSSWEPSQRSCPEPSLMAQAAILQVRTYLFKNPFLQNIHGVASGSDHWILSDLPTWALLYFPLPQLQSWKYTRKLA